MEVVDVFKTERTIKIKEIAQKFVDKLIALPATSKYMDEITSINVIDEFPRERVMGFFKPITREIFIVAKGFFEEMEEDEIESEVGYVIMHELGHRVADKLSPINNGYDSYKKNKEYYKEELRADSFAKMIAKKYFGEVKGIVKVATERFEYILKMFKDLGRNYIEKYSSGYKWVNISSSDYYEDYYSNNSYSWSYNGFAVSTSNLALAC